MRERYHDEARQPNVQTGRARRGGSCVEGGVEGRVPLGAIETGLGSGAVRNDTALNARIAGTTALGRVGLPDDVGPMTASLVSDANRWVNGQRIEVSGGILL